jgi:arylsulfatase
VSNTPFQLFKHWTHEGGIATPFIAYYPGKIQKASIDHRPAHIIDLMATSVEYAGAHYPKVFNGQAIQPMEGISLKALFENKSWKGHHALYWSHEGNKAIRQGNWKLVSSHGSGKDSWQLYELQKDRTEMVDVSKQFAAVVKKLQALHTKWEKRIGVVSEEELSMRRKGALNSTNKGD